MKNRILLLLLLFCSITDAALAGDAKFIRLPNRIPDIYIVVLSNELPSPAAAIAKAVTREHGVELMHTSGVGMNAFVFKGPEAAALAMSRSPMVQYIEEGAELQAIAGGQYQPPWNLDRIDQRTPTMDFWYIWGYTGVGVVAYVLDTGVNLVSDLNDQAVPPQSRVIERKNFVLNDDGAVGDVHAGSHGTKIASIIAGTSNGVAKDARIVSYRVGTPSGFFPNYAIIAALGEVRSRYVTNANELSVVNYSATGGTGVFDPALEQAFDATRNLGISIVVAAGDYYDNACDHSPARMGSGNIITVGGTTQNDARTNSSGYGPCVDTYAPAVAIGAMDRNGFSSTFAGTSAAVPQVVGVAALHLQRTALYGLVGSPSAIEGYIKDYATPAVVTNIPESSAGPLLYSRVPPKTRPCC